MNSKTVDRFIDVKKCIKTGEHIANCICSMFSNLSGQRSTEPCPVIFMLSPLLSCPFRNCCRLQRMCLKTD